MKQSSNGLVPHAWMASLNEVFEIEIRVCAPLPGTLAVVARLRFRQIVTRLGTNSGGTIVRHHARLHYGAVSERWWFPRAQPLNRIST